MDPTYDQELYKHLLEENAKYIEKVHQTWNQKLLIVGAMAAFVFAKDNTISQSVPLSVVLLGIPIICVILDAHLLEKALQARIISHFIIREYEEPGKSRSWCKTFWAVDTADGDQPRGLLRNLLGLSLQRGAVTIDAIVGLRSAFTAIVTIMPTVLVFFVVASAVWPKSPEWTMPIAATLSLLYFAGGAAIFRSLRQKLESEHRPTRQSNRPASPTAD